jgi:hypothetical protein
LKKLDLFVKVSVDPFKSVRRQVASAHG